MIISDEIHAAHAAHNRYPDGCAACDCIRDLHDLIVVESLCLW